MDASATAALHSAGLDYLVPVVISAMHAIVAIVALASAINALVPQPKP